MTGKTHKKAAVATAVSAAIVASAVVGGLAGEIAGLQVVPLLWLPLSPFGGYTPDIDKGRTTARNWFNRVFTIYTAAMAILIPLLIVLRLEFYFVLLAVASEGIFLGLMILIKFSKHRRESHSITFIAVLWLLNIMLYTNLSGVSHWLAIGAFNLVIGLIIGVISHLLIDNFNVRQLHWFFPLELILGWYQRRKAGPSAAHKKIKPVFIIPTIGKIVTQSPQEKIFISIFVGVVVGIGFIVASIKILLSAGVLQ